MNTNPKLCFGKILRNLLLSLLALLALTGLFLPDALFTLLDARENGRSFQEDVTAVDLTLTPDLTYHERITLFQKRQGILEDGDPVIVFVDYAQEGSSESNKIEDAALAYLNTLFQRDIDMELPYKVSVLPLLYTDSKHTAVFWQAEYCIQDTLELTLILDGSTRTVVSLSLVISEDAAAGHITDELQEVAMHYRTILEQSFAKAVPSNPVWTEINGYTVRENSDQGSLCYYKAYMLHVHSLGQYGRYTMVIEPDGIFFNTMSQNEVMETMWKMEREHS